jgi:hypothetical protein
LPQDRRTLTFTNPTNDDAIPLETRLGTAYLYMSQELLADADGKAFRLRTTKYAYKLFAQCPKIDDDSVIRWEYESAPRVHSGACRHHVQFGKMAQPITFGSGAFDLTRFHMPTGWVTIEEVFRFLICELDVKPPCGDRWPQVLGDSERAFFEGFTDKGASGYVKG